MTKYIGGPFDGQSFSTCYDHLRIIRLPCPRNAIEMEPVTIEHYEMRHGKRYHIASESFSPERPCND